MKQSIKLLVILLVSLLLTNCSSDTKTVASNCDSSSSEFQSIFGIGGTVSYDFDVHSYDFVLSQNKTICKIGYQSATYNVSNPYIIKILQGSTVIYSQPHLFNDTAISYVTPTSTINLSAGITYTIERWQTNSGLDNLQNVGLIKTGTTFPASSSFMSVVSSDFYFDSSYINPILSTPNGTIAPNTSGVDLAIPFIDIIFK
jgi:hypothetical protein